MQLTTEKKKNLFYAMLRIRRVEERIEALYLEDKMKTPIHLCIGQEAVAAGVCGALEKDDYVTSNHRGHGHYLAKGGNLKRMIAELYCKSTGCSRGYGGSMHLVDVSVGHMGSSSIVGGGIPIATGLSLGIQMKSEKRVSVAFFGDGAVNEGVLYESINFAMLKKLPVIYIFENNQWSVCSHFSARQTDDVLFHKASPESLFTSRIDGNNALLVCTTANIAIDRARSGQGPSFIQCDTYRISPHAGCFAQDLTGYRDHDEERTWKEKCPIHNLQKHLVEECGFTYDELAAMEEIIAAEIDAAFVFAQKSALPTTEKMTKYLFRG